MNKVIITCAVCGAETTKKHNPALPVTPEEIAQSTFEAYQAGAAIVHLHVRDENGEPTQDIKIFKKTMELIKEKCDIVIELTTGGAVGMTDEERLQIVELKPEMASLDCGTVNFGDEYILNTLPTMRTFAKAFTENGIFPTFECFDVSHIDSSKILIKEGLLKPPYHYGFVLNVPGAAKYDVGIMDFMVKRLPEDCQWTAMGIGRASLPAQYGAIGMGGHIRVGFEDNVFYSKGVLAENNAHLVKRASRLIKEAGMEVATPADVRKMFNLRGKFGE